MHERDRHTDGQTDGHRMAAKGLGRACIASRGKNYLNKYSTMKIEDTEMLGRQRAKSSKIKVRSSRPTYKNCYCLCTINAVAQRQFC